jgi:hypothetical protein
MASGVAKVKAGEWPAGLVGAAIGAAVGASVFFLLTRLGFYALILPGAVLGLGCGALSGGKSNALGVACGVLGLVVGVLTEWRFAPFIVDASLGYFVKHLGDLESITKISIVAGGVFAFWFGKGREGGAWPRRTEPTVVPASRDMAHMRATANAHIKRDMEAGRKWVCQCPDCHEVRSLIGVDKTLEVRPLVRKILRLEEQLETMPDGPDMQAVLDEYLKAYDELAEVMAK